MGLTSIYPNTKIQFLNCLPSKTNFIRKNQVLGQGYHGGIPPTLKDIDCEKDKMTKFVECWLGHHKLISTPMQEFLIANMLRHWPETVDFIQKEPKGRYSGEKYKNHAFVLKIKYACLYNGIDELTFDKWVKSIRHGFIRRNAISMSQELLKEIGYDNACIDGRSFLEMMEANTRQ